MALNKGMPLSSQEERENAGLCVDSEVLFAKIVFLSFLEL